MQKNNKKLNSSIAIILVFAGIFFTTKVNATDLSDEIAENVNIERQKQGKNILSRNKALDKAAFLKAQDMVGNNYFAHTSPEGVDPWYWVGEVDYQYKYAGENLAMDFRTADAVHKAWMKSPTHKDNIISEKYTEIGIAVVKGIIKEGENETNIAVQFFATPFAEKRMIEEQQREQSGDKTNEIAIKNGEKIEVIEASVQPWEGETADEMLIYTKVSGEVEKVTAFIGKEAYQLEKLSGDKYMNLVQLDKNNLKENKIIIKIEINSEKAIFHQIPKYQYLDYLDKEKEETENKNVAIASVKDASSGVGGSRALSQNIILAGFVLVCLAMVANVWVLEEEEARLLENCQAKN